MNTKKMVERLVVVGVFALPTVTTAGVASYFENERNKELEAAKKAGATLERRFQSVAGVGGFWRQEVKKPEATTSSRGMPFRTGF